MFDHFCLVYKIGNNIGTFYTWHFKFDHHCDNNVYKYLQKFPMNNILTKELKNFSHVHKKSPSVRVKCSSIPEVPWLSSLSNK